MNFGSETADCSLSLNCIDSILITKEGKKEEEVSMKKDSEEIESFPVVEGETTSPVLGSSIRTKERMGV